MTGAEFERFMRINPQQRHELCLTEIKDLLARGYTWASVEVQGWNRRNDFAVAEYYGLSLEELELNLEVCWR